VRALSPTPRAAPTRGHRHAHRLAPGRHLRRVHQPA
jgi:hypothetical protein